MQQRTKGIAMVLFSAVCWGLSGTAAQVLFRRYGFHPNWLVSCRMILSGLVLVGAGSIQRKRPAIRFIRAKESWFALLIFAVAGLLGVQYTYFKAIALGNAASATLLQYLGPTMLVIMLATRAKRLPTRSGLVAVALSIAGTYLLVTSGHLGHLALTWSAVIWGLLSALGLAFYTIFPVKMIHKWGATPVVGWAMLIGGLVSSPTAPIWQAPRLLDARVIALVAFIVLLGTLAAFSLYLASLKFLSATESSLFASAEPIAAAVASVTLLHVHMTLVEASGGALIIVAVTLLAWLKPFQSNPSEEHVA